MARDDLINDLIADAREILDNLESSLLELEQASEMSSEMDVIEELLQSIFRNMHTLKGSSGFFNLPTIVKTAHESETILELLRRHPALLNIQTIEALFQTRDFLFRLFQSVEINRHDNGFEKETEELIKVLHQARDSLGETPPADSSNTEDSKKQQETQLFGFFDFSESPTELEKSPPDKKSESLQQDKPEKPERETPPNDDLQTRSGKSELKNIRIPIEKLDALVDLVGELVITDSMIHRQANLEEDIIKIRRISRQLHRIVTTLQEHALNLRMVSLSNVFQKMRRLTQDLSHKFSKNIKLHITGDHTEIDKSVIEHITDPLVHLIRNAVDHGLETGSERLEVGKPEECNLYLQAVHVGNEVHIMIRDDGRGLNRDKILARARSLELIDDSVSPGEQEIFDFIFHQGFSTATSLTDISGRGVGLDVVRKNLRRINGQVDVDSTPGEGTTFTLKIPLTLAIIDGMVVRIKNYFYVIPTAEISKSVAADPNKLTVIHEKNEIYKLEDELIPVVRLNNVLLFHDASEDNDIYPLIVFLQKNDKRLGIFVDEILGNQQVVIKALPEYLENLHGVPGCTILGNGDISLILDIHSLIDRFGQANQVESAEGVA